MGLSSRDIEAAFRDEQGASVLSRSLVSEVTELLWADYQTFASRGLAEFKVHEVKAAAWASYPAASPRLAELRREEFVRTHERELPSATACFLDDFEACIAHLKLPLAHRKATRTANLLAYKGRLPGFAGEAVEV